MSATYCTRGVLVGVGGRGESTYGSIRLPVHWGGDTVVSVGPVPGEGGVGWGRGMLLRVRVGGWGGSP